MRLTLQIVITDESGLSRTEELMTLQKLRDARNDIGLSFSESKQLLNTVQQSVVQLQADEYTHNHIQCPHCLAAGRIKGRQKIQHTGHCLALFLYRGFGCNDAVARRVRQKPSVWSVTGLAITPIIH